MTPQAALADHVMAPPYVAKPVAEGSSVGVVIVRSGANRPPEAIRTIPVTREGQIMVEKFVAGRELTCCVIGDQVTGDHRHRRRPTTWNSTTTRPSMRPAARSTSCRRDIPDAIRRAIQGHTLAAHRALGCRGVSRSDFRWDEAKDELAFLEINTQPGMTPTSLVPELGQHMGLSFGALVAWLVEDASILR